VAIRYGKGLLGWAAVLVILALLVHWIGIDTIERYRDDLVFYLQAHLILVLASMRRRWPWASPPALPQSTAPGRQSRTLHAVLQHRQHRPPGRTGHRPGVLGIGAGPAIFALFLASLPIVRNTYEGLKNVPASLKEAATGIGMTPRQVLWRWNCPTPCRSSSAACAWPWRSTSAPRRWRS
jgi:osmoprotectant transport system permease protein